MIDDNEAKKRILWLGIEDAAGLWEIPWDLELDISGPEVMARLRELVGELVDQGLLLLSERIEPLGPSRTLSAEDGRRVLTEIDRWTEPSVGQKSVRLETTEKGETAYAAYPARSDVDA